MKKAFGLIFTAVGGIVAGIGLASNHSLPHWWWLLGLLFIGVGAMLTMYREEE